MDWSESRKSADFVNINIGDDLTDRWGNVYEDIIETVSFVDVKRKEVGDIDSLVTLYTNDVVGVINSPAQNPDDFYVTKTEFISNRTGDDGLRVDYDYQIFSKDNHVNQHIYKSIFYLWAFIGVSIRSIKGFGKKISLKKIFYVYI